MAEAPRHGGTQGSRCFTRATPAKRLAIPTVRAVRQRGSATGTPRTVTWTGERQKQNDLDCDQGPKGTTASGRSTGPHGFVCAIPPRPPRPPGSAGVVWVVFPADAQPVQQVLVTPFSCSFSREGPSSQGPGESRVPCLQLRLAVDVPGRRPALARPPPSSFLDAHRRSSHPFLALLSFRRPPQTFEKETASHGHRRSLLSRPLLWLRPGVSRAPYTPSPAAAAASSSQQPPQTLVTCPPPAPPRG